MIEYQIYLCNAHGEQASICFYRGSSLNPLLSKARLQARRNFNVYRVVGDAAPMPFQQYRQGVKVWERK